MQLDCDVRGNSVIVRNGF